MADQNRITEGSTIRVRIDRLAMQMEMLHDLDTFIFLEDYQSRINEKLVPTFCRFERKTPGFQVVNRPNFSSECNIDRISIIDPEVAKSEDERQQDVQASLTPPPLAPISAPEKVSIFGVLNGWLVRREPRRRRRIKPGNKDEQKAVDFDFDRGRDGRCRLAARAGANGRNRGCAPSDVAPVLHARAKADFGGGASRRGAGRGNRNRRSRFRDCLARARRGVGRRRRCAAAAAAAAQPVHFGRADFATTRAGLCGCF